MSLSSAIWGQFRWGTTRWGFATPPPSPYADVQAQVLLSIAQRLVNQGVVSNAATVAMSLKDMPPLLERANYAINLAPGEGSAIEDLTTGGGRYTSGITDTIHVRLFNRCALDWGYMTTSGLADVNFGALILVHAILDSLHLFFPTSTTGRLLTMEPIRFLSASQPEQYETDKSWYVFDLAFECRYNLAILGGIGP